MVGWNPESRGSWNLAATDRCKGCPWETTVLANSFPISWNLEDVANMWDQNHCMLFNWTAHRISWAFNIANPSSLKSSYILISIWPWVIRTASDSELGVCWGLCLEATLLEFLGFLLDFPSSLGSGSNNVKSQLFQNSSLIRPSKSLPQWCVQPLLSKLRLFRSHMILLGSHSCRNPGSWIQK